MLNQAGTVIEAVIDHGDQNLFTVDMCRFLASVLSAPPEDAHVLRLRAEGCVFCLGRERSAAGPVAMRDETAALIGLNRAIAASRLVTVAEVQGDAAGYGVGVAALCDVSVATASARFWFPEIAMDLAPTVVLAWLVRAVGAKQAFLLTATGEPISARRAAELGLLTEVVGEEQALGDVVAARVATLAGKSPAAHADIKRFIAVTADLAPEAAYELAGDKLSYAGLSRQFSVGSGEN